MSEINTPTSELKWMRKKVRSPEGTIDVVRVKRYGGRKYAHVRRVEEGVFEVVVFPSGHSFFTDTLQSAQLLAEAYFAGVHEASIYGM